MIMFMIVFLYLEFIIFSYYVVIVVEYFLKEIRKQGESYIVCIYF